MRKKASHDELEKRVKQLEKELLDCKRVRETLREREEEYRCLVEATEDSIYLLDKNCTYLLINKKHLLRIGLAVDKVIGRRYGQLHSEDDTKELAGKLKEVFETGVSVQHEHRSRRDGRYFIRTLSPIKEPDGRTVAVTVVSKDVTEHRQAEAAVRESEQRCRTLFEESKDVIYITTREGRFVDINQSGLDLFGYSREEIMRLDVQDLYTRPEERARFQQEIEEKGFAKDYGIKLCTKDGTERDCLLSSTVRQANDGTILGYQGIVRDITDHKRTKERIRSLNQQLIKTHEIERQRLSCDLHDNLAQDLSSLKISLDTLFDDVPGVSAEKTQRLSELSTMVKRAIMDVRDMAYDLHPTSLSQLGLVQTVHRYCEDFSAKNGLKVDLFSVGLDSIKPDFDTEITLYRLIQEGLSNIQKHADASHVTIRLVTSHPHIILCIEDNGKGFMVKKRLREASQEKRMGLHGMERRVALLNGKIEIKSRPGRGTKIMAEVPCTEKNNG